MSLEDTLTKLRPTARRWREWRRAEPALPIDYPTLLQEREHGLQHRKDELVAALTRLARHDAYAVEVLCACMWPGLRRLIRRARSLDRDDAEAIAVTGLTDAIARFPAEAADAPDKVASRLLDLPRHRLGYAIQREHKHRSRNALSNDPDNAQAHPGNRPSVPGIRLRLPVLLHEATTAGVLAPADAWLLCAVDHAGHSIGFAARQLGVSYDAARMRRQRAARRLADWWAPETESAAGTPPGTTPERPTAAGTATATGQIPAPPGIAALPIRQLHATACREGTFRDRHVLREPPEPPLAVPATECSA